MVGIGRAGRALALLLVVLVAGACQLRVEVNVDVAEDGSGTVEVAVALDDDAARRRPHLAEELRTEDLTEAGWELVGPRVEDDGLTWIRARHPFATPAELGPLVEQISGPEGPFRDFGLTRSDSFATSRYRFSATVDFTAGVEGFSDPEATENLGGEPLGQSVEAIEQQLGASIDEMVQLQVAVRLPGEVSSNAPTRADNGAVWRPSVVADAAERLSAEGVVTRRQRVVWLVVAVAAGVVLVLFVLIRIAVARRARSA